MMTNELIRSASLMLLRYSSIRSSGLLFLSVQFDRPGFVYHALEKQASIKLFSETKR